jgi:hypothetical protein
MQGVIRLLSQIQESSSTFILLQKLMFIALLL